MLARSLTFIQKEDTAQFVSPFPALPIIIYAPSGNAAENMKAHKKHSKIAEYSLRPSLFKTRTSTAKTVMICRQEYG